MGEDDRRAPVEGELFRRNYQRPIMPLSDSSRARQRLYKLFDSTGTKQDREGFHNVVEAKLGIEYPSSTWGYLDREFWTKAEVGDVLSAVTLWCRSAGQHFRDEARHVFIQEHLRYRIDDKGGVHFLVDEEFERTIAVTIAGLGAPRFASSLHALEEGLSNLGTTKQSGKGLIRGVFEAVESAFLEVVGKPSGLDRVNAPAIDKYLKPILLQHYAAYPEADDKVDRLLEHFKYWTKSAHPFRHGAALEQIHEAPLDLAILSATQGIGYLRFLASL